MINLIEPARASRPRREVVRSAFGMGPAEVAVALRLFDGGRLKQIAEETGVGVATVRTHLAQVFEKCETHRQVDLVRLLAHLDPTPDD